MESHSPLIRKIQFGFVTVAVVLLVVGGIAYRSVAAATQSAQWSDHSSRVLGHLETLRLSVEGIASGHRDFSFSGDRQFLQVSRTNAILANRELGILRGLMSDNQDQERRLGVVDRSV